MNYMNEERQRLHHNLTRSQSNSSSHDMAHFGEYNMAVDRLKNVLGEKHDISREMDAVRSEHNRMPTPSQTTGIGRLQSIGIEHQRKEMFELMDQIKSQIKSDIMKGRN